MYAQIGQTDKAEPILDRVLKLREAKLGTDHPDVAQSLTHLADMYQMMGQHDKAEALFRRSLKILETKLDPTQLSAARYPLHDLAMLLAAEARWAEAATEFDKSRRVSRMFMTDSLPLLDENDQLQFLRTTDALLYHTSLSLGPERRNDPKIVEQSESWLLNGKCVGQEGLALHNALISTARNHANVALLLNELNRNRSDSPEASLQRLYETVRKYVPAVSHQTAWVELATVRMALGKDSVLIDVARFPIWDFGNNGNPSHAGAEHYIAWMIPAADQGPIEIVDLGPAKAIDDAIRDARPAFRFPQGAIDKKGKKTPESRPAETTKAPSGRGIELDPDSEEDSTAAMRSLERLILEPLRSHFGRADRLIISPDSDLWLVPWAALPLPEGNFAIEKYKIRYAVSGRDLVRRTASKGLQPNAPVVFANPDYDLAAATVIERTRAVLGDAGVGGGSDLLVSDDLAGISRVTRLPGTASEAAAIQPLLKKFCKVAPVAYTDEYALKAVFQALHGPRVVVMSTHGFTLPDQKAAKRNTRLEQWADTRSARRGDKRRRGHRESASPLRSSAGGM